MIGRGASGHPELLLVHWCSAVPEQRLAAAHLGQGCQGSLPEENDVLSVA